MVLACLFSFLVGVVISALTILITLARDPKVIHLANGEVVVAQAYLSRLRQLAEIVLKQNRNALEEGDET